MDPKFLKKKTGSCNMSEVLNAGSSNKNFAVKSFL